MSCVELATCEVMLLLTQNHPMVLPLHTGLCRDMFGRILEQLAAYVPILPAIGNHELEPMSSRWGWRHLEAGDKCGATPGRTFNGYIWMLRLLQPM